MTLPVPNQQTWAVSELVTAAMMNANVRDAVDFLTAPPVFLGYQSVAQSLANGATTAITLDSEVIDTYNGHSTATNTDRYVAQVAGWYLCIGVVGLAPNATGVRETVIGVNGSFPTPLPRQIAPTPSAGNAEVQCVQLVHLNAGDYVNVSGIQTSGGALNTVVNYSSLTVLWQHS